MDTESVRIVVGVAPGIHDAVLAAAARLASRTQGDLICAFVDRNRYVVDANPDGSVRSMPIDPDLPDAEDDAFPKNLQEQLDRILSTYRINWSTQVLAGDPAWALGHLAEAIGAEFIVVGTRDATARATVQEFFGGSVAVHLAHRQHRPVVVVPLAPADAGQALPWEQ